MFYSSRKGGGPDLHLDWKVRVFFLGALLAFIGIAAESQPVVFVAIAVLLVGILLRFVPAGRRTEPSEDDPQDPQDPQGPLGPQESHLNRDDAELG